MDISTKKPAEEKGRAPLTPLMQQYHDLKSQYPTEILLFRLGDFCMRCFTKMLKPRRRFLKSHSRTANRFRCAACPLIPSNPTSPNS